MNFSTLFHLVWPYVLQVGGAAFAVFLGKHIKTATDAARAQAIAVIAKDIASAVYANNPTLPYLDMVKAVIDAMALNVPTTNPVIIERAAISAIQALVPAVKK